MRSKRPPRPPDVAELRARFHQIKEDEKIVAAERRAANAQVNADGRVTNAVFATKDPTFRNWIKVVNMNLPLGATTRQASKWRNRRGLAYQAMRRARALVVAS